MNNGHSRSTLFLMEQLVVILIFAVCASVCVRIFVESYLMERRTLEINNAVLTAGSGAECYKAAGGDARDAASILGGAYYVASGDGAAVYYDERWHPCEEAYAAYVLRLVPEHSPALPRVKITVYKTDGEELAALTVAARGGA